MFNYFKKFKFIQAICDQINKLPPNIVGLLTILFVALGAVIFGISTIAAFGILMYVLVFIMTSTLAIPYGFGVGILGFVLSVFFKSIVFDQNLNSNDIKLLFKKLIKPWILAGIIGYTIISLFPAGRDLLIQSQALDFSGSDKNIDPKFWIGVYAFSIGWTTILAIKLPKVLACLLKVFTSINNDLKKMGSDSIKKCRIYDQKYPDSL